MLPDRVSNPGPLTYEPDTLSIALRGPARSMCVICGEKKFSDKIKFYLKACR